MKRRQAMMQAAEIEPILLDVKKAAARYCHTERAIRAKVLKHAIPFIKVGDRILFVVADCDAFFQSKTVCTLEQAQENAANMERQ